MEGVVSKIFYYFEWSTELIANLLDSSRVGIELDLKMRFDDVSNFEVLGWGEVIVMKSTIASVAFLDKNFEYLLRE